MLDVRRIRSDPDEVRKALARRRDGSEEGVDQVLALDQRLRSLAGARDEARTRVKALSRQVGSLRREGKAEEADAVAAESRQAGDDEKRLAAEADQVAEELRRLLLRIPNVPAAEAPDGDDESDNVVLKTVDFDPDAYGDHQRVPHWDIAARLGILDLERAAKISGSMFVMFRGLGATLSRALCQLAIDRNADAFEEIRPPHLVSSATLTASGQLPKFADDAYHVERDDLWAIPTAEVPLTSLARDEILREDQLPMRLMAYTPCYRREAGSAGKDTRGLLRSHEFDKVEILAYSTPEQGAGMLDELLGRAEASIAALGLAYRLVDICTGDLGQTHHRSIDIEVYAPGCDKWLEVSSVSWFSDYQARRANIRYRPAGGGSPVVAHTLNGSALAVPRVWAALVETYHQPDGSVAIPECLHPYLRGATSIPAV
jgi:seryl-tRNA synthetase